MTEIYNKNIENNTLQFRRLIQNLSGKLAGPLGRLQKLPGRVLKVRSRKALLFFAGVLIILLPIAYLVLKNPAEAKAATLSLSTTASTIQIDVPNRYQAVMTTNDTNNYLVFKDRAENDGTPDTVLELRGADIGDEGVSYELRYDDTRTTTILESSSTRVRVRVEGCFDTSGGGACLKDVEGGNDDVLEVTEEYTFTANGVFVNSQFDFKDGIELDGTGSWDEANVLEAYFNEGGSNYHSDTILHGGGETEGTSDTSQIFTYDTDKYVVLQGISNYQDIIVGTMKRDGDRVLSNSTTGHMYHSQSSNDYFNIKDDTTQTVVGVGSAQHFIQFHDQSDLNTEVEREALFNDVTNPDYLSHTVGEPWDNKPFGDFIFASGFEGGASNLCSGGDGWSGGSCESGNTAVGNDSSAAFNGNYAAKFISTGTNDIARVSTDLGVAYDTLYVRLYFRLDSHDLGTWNELGIVRLQDSVAWQDNRVMIQEDGGSGNLQLVLSDTASSYQDSGDYIEIDTWYSLEWLIYRHPTAGTGDLWLNGDHILSSTSLDTGDNSLDYVLVGLTTSATNTNQIFIDNVIVSESYIGTAQYNEAEGAYTSDMSAGDVEVDIDAGPNVSTLINDVTDVEAGAASITVDSTTGFPSSGVAYIEGDKFSYTGITSTTFTGIPSIGELSIIGHADNSVVSLSQRYAPLYKFRNYQSNDAPQTVTLEQDTLTQGTEYNSSVKPFTTSYFAQELIWYSSLENASAVTNPNVGSAATNSGADFVAGKYGNGAEMLDDNDDILIPITGGDSGNFDKAKGAIEFWFKPTYDFGDSVKHYLFQMYEDANNQFYVHKDSSNFIYFNITANGTASAFWTTSGVDWSANDWVHLRFDWDDTASLDDQARIFVNGVEPPHNTPGNDYDSTNLTLDTYLRIGGGDTDENDGVIDEFRVYGGSASNPITLSKGGDATDSDEYLANPTNDYTFDFNDDDANNRGEYIWLGSDSPFGGVNMDLATDGVGSSEDFDWEYWSGTSWSALSVTEQDSGSSSFTGDGNFYFTPPADWFPYSVNGSTDLYYIRGHLEGGSYTTDPIEGRMQTDVLLFHYQDNIIEENQTLRIPGITSGANPPAAYWALDEGYGTTANDSSGNGNHGTLTGATWQPSDLCYSGKCLYFDGTNDEITRTDDPSFDIDDSGSFTISTWFRHPGISTNPDVIAAKYEGTGGDGGYRLQMESDGDISFGIDDENTSFPEDTVTSTTANYDDNKWHHVAGVKDANDNLFLYIDGNLIDTDAAISATDSLGNNDDFYLGIDGDGTSNAWAGFIDEFKFYRYARSADEIKADMAKGAGVKGSSTSYGLRDYSYLSDGLVGYWKMDEASWTNDCSTDTVFDSSGNGNDGDSCPNTTGPTGGAAGKFGNGGNFDGSNDVVEIPDDPDLEPANDMTVAAWVTFEQLAGTKGEEQNFVIKKHSVSPFDSYKLFQEDDSGTEKLVFCWRSTVLNCSKETYGTLSIDTWYHVVGVKTANEVKICVNGICDPDYTETPTGTLFSSDEPLNIGATWTGGQRTDGTIDEVRVYNRALSPSEIDALYNWAPGPVGYWNFDEGDGSAAYDNSGNDITGTITDATWVTGKYGSALHFDGSEDRVALGSPSELDLSNNLSIFAWVKFEDVIDDNFGNKIIAQCNSSGSPGQFDFDIGRTDNELSVVWGGAVIDDSTSNLQTGTWHYVGFTRSGSSGDWTSKIYIDGVLDETATSVATNPGSQLYTSIGKCGEYNGTNSNYYEGYIDEVKIYNYARTPSQIIEDMNAGHPLGGSPLPSQVGWWKFDEGYGDVANDSGSGGNNGDLAGSGTTCPQSGDSACPSWTNSGKFGKALDFDLAGATDDHVQTSSNELATADEFTMTTWFKADSTVAHKMILWQGDVIGNGYGNGSMNQQEAHFSIGNYIGSDVNDKLTFFLGDTHETNDAGVLHISVDFTDTANWHHLAGVVRNLSTSPESEFYIDGVLVGTDTGTTTRTSRTNWNTNLRIGRPGEDWRQFDGQIDEVKIYTAALTADQVKLDMNQGKSAVWGATSTTSSGSPSFSSAREYCIPGDSSTCNPPVGEWKFDEKIGTTANDTSENSNSGSLVNGPVWEHAGSCKQGSCINFDGTDDRVSHSNNDLGDNIGTISLWLKSFVPTDSDGFFSTEAGGRDKAGYIDSSTYHMAVYDGSAWRDRSGGTVDNDWHHISFTWDGSAGDTYLYIDSVLVDSDDGTSWTGGTDTWTNIGRQALSYGGMTDAYWEGLIDDVKIYDYVRTPAQIAWSYNKGGPVGYWKFDECSGTTANDSGSGGNNGTITPGTGAPPENTATGTCSSGNNYEMWNDGTTGKVNASLGFDGNDDIVTIPDDNSLDITSAISLSAWIKVNSFSPDHARIMTKDSTTQGNPFSWMIESNASLQFCQTGLSACNFETGANTLQAGVWHHVAAVWDGTNRYLYIDGKQRAFEAQSGTMAVNDNDLTIGNNADNNRDFDGQIDEVKIFNYALTPEQIKTEYTQGAISFN